MAEQDQVQGLERTESEEVVEKDTSSDNQESQEQEQSNEGQGEQEGSPSKLYKLPDGREVTADEVYKEYVENLLPEFTRRSQELAELKRQLQDRENRAGKDARQAINEDELLKDVPPDVKEAIIRIVQPILDSKFEELERQRAQQEADEAFERELQTLEKEFPGGDGRPKFDRDEVLRAMQDPNNRIFDPRTKFMQMYEKEFNDLLIREALKKQRGGTETENTGGGPRKPERNVPKTFEEAARAFSERLKNL